MKDALCFECGATAEHFHHVVPKSQGGTKTLPLCGPCHSKVHSPGQELSKSSLCRLSLIPRKPNKLTVEMILSMTKQREGGLTYREIGRMHNVSYVCARNAVLGIGRLPSAVADLRSSLLDPT